MYPDPNSRSMPRAGSCYSYPYVPIAGTVRIGIAIFSYLGGLNFGLTGDYDAVPDLEILKRGIESGMADLLGAARPPARPARPARMKSSVTGNRAKRPARRPAGRSASAPAPSQSAP